MVGRARHPLAVLLATALALAALVACACAIPGRLHAQPVRAAGGAGDGCPAADSVAACVARGLALAQQAMVSTQHRDGSADPLRLRAAAVLDAACERGAAPACHTAARLVSIPPQAAAVSDSAVRRGLEQAAALYDKGCRRQPPHGPSCGALGDAYLHGLGVARNDEAAFALLTLACDLRDPAACSQLAGRRLAMPEFGPARAAGEEARLRGACDAGSQTGCSRLGALLQARVAALPYAQRAHPAVRAVAGESVRRLRLGCGASAGGGSAAYLEPTGCTALGLARADSGLGVPHDSGAARTLLLTACRGSVGRTGDVWLGDGAGCRRLAERFLADTPSRADSASAFRFYDRGCVLRDGLACARYAELGDRLGDSAGLYPAESLRWADVACRDVGEGCRVAAELLTGPDHRDTARAFVYYQKGCDLEDAQSCRVLARRALGLGQSAHAVKYLRRGCNWQDALSCGLLASYFQRELLDSSATQFRVRGCEAGDAYLCREVLRASRAVRGEDRERQLRREAREGRLRALRCRADANACKQKDT